MRQNCWTKKIPLIAFTFMFCVGLIAIIGSGGGDDSERPANANALWVQGVPPYQDLTVHFLECSVTERENTQYDLVHDDTGRLIEWKWQITLNSGNCTGQSVNLIIHPLNGTFTQQETIRKIEP